MQLCCCSPDLLKLKPEMLYDVCKTPVAQQGQSHRDTLLAPWHLTSAQSAGEGVEDSQFFNEGATTAQTSPLPTWLDTHRRVQACQPLLSLLLEHWAWQWPCVPQGSLQTGDSPSVSFQPGIPASPRMSLTIHIPRGCFLASSVSREGWQVLVWQDEPGGWQ